jgi:hypothetical protein
MLLVMDSAIRTTDEFPQVAGPDGVAGEVGRVGDGPLARATPQGHTGCRGSESCRDRRTSRTQIMLDRGLMKKVRG